MAIYKEFENNLIKDGAEWENKTGKLVEDYICRNLIKDGIYENANLILKNVQGDLILSVPISAVNPQYNYSVKIFGVKINDSEMFNAGSLTVSDLDTITLIVGAYCTIELAGNVKDKSGQVKAFINYKSSLFDNISILETILLIPKNSFTFDSSGKIIGYKDETQLTELNVSLLFKNYKSEGLLHILLSPPDAEKAENTEDTLNLKITCETPFLKYPASNYYTSESNVTFTLSGGTSGKYTLEGYNNGLLLDNSKITELKYSDLKPGLNLLIIRAKHIESNIYSLWLYVDLIYTLEYTGTVIAVNNVSSSIDNNGVYELYHLTVYSNETSYPIDGYTLNTYLENGAVTQGTNLIKGETIYSHQYTNNIYTTNYKKYIEEPSSGQKWLLIEFNDEYYKFRTPKLYGSEGTISSTCKQITIEAPNTNFMYYKDSNISYNYDLITGQVNNLFTKDTISLNIQPSDGWIENDGICIFRTTAQEESILKNPLDLRLQHSGFSLEFGLKTFNISNKSKPICSLGKLQLWPTLVVWWDESDSSGEFSDIFTSRNSLFLEGVDTHIMITVLPNYKLSSQDPYYPKFLKGSLENFDRIVKSFSFNLVRIYINGGIDRAFILNEDELNQLINSKLIINPTTADVDWYLFRVYNTEGLSDTYVLRNYNSFIFDKSLKLEFFDKNDIVGNNGMISFSKSRKKQNTIVLVLPKGVSFPNYTWDTAMEDLAKEKPSTMFIEYKDPSINLTYGGRINYGQIKGLGTSAKRYLIWNVQNLFGKYKDKGFDSIFTSYSPTNFDENTNKFKPNATATQKNCYVMPTYYGLVDPGSKVKKSVGKVNWASSMQSHKVGACKLYEDAYKNLYPNTKGKIGKKAVHEEPYLYFYWETDLEDVSDVLLNDVLNAELEGQIKFAGFQTWGAGKGDKFESGYGDDTPEYLMLEGGENANPSVNFRVPWHSLQNSDEEGNLHNTPKVSKTESLNDPSLGLKIDDESIVYNNLGAWDIDFGCAKDKKSFLPTVKTSLIRFRQFYDFVYKHDFSVKIVSGDTLDSNNFTTTDENGNQILDTEHKYLVITPQGKFNINGVPVVNHQSGDIYRYDVITSTWVPAGLYYTNGAWERFNIYEEFPELLGDSSQILDYIKHKFTEGIVDFIDKDDIAFHQAFVKLVLGTDNLAKNTYFLIIGPRYIENNGEFTRPEIENNNWDDYKIRLIGDDLDSIFGSDNAGLQSKPYNLLEVAYDPSFKNHWGDAHNIFFYMFNLCFEKEIKDNLKGIIDKAFENKSVTDKTSYFYRNFFNVLEDFPVVAYNHTSRLYYENAYIISKNKVISGYTNNLGVDPIGQIHGSCLACEKLFITERMDFLNGYAQTNLINYYSTYDGSGGPSPMKINLEFTPYLDFYPNYGHGALGGGSALPYYILGNTSEIDAIEAIAKKDKLIHAVIDRPNANTYSGIFLTHLYKTLNIIGSKETSLPELPRGVNIEVDNSINESGISKFKLEEFNDSSYPVLEDLTLKNVELPSTLVLSNCTKLKSIDLTNSNTQSVKLPISGRLQTLILPGSIKSFEIIDNRNLKTVNIQEYNNIINININCARCGEFDVSDFCEKIKNNSLSEVLLYNCNLTLTEESLLNLCKAETCNITGTIEISDKLTFEGKKILVEKFGNIDNSSNDLYITYTSVAFDITVPDSINVFKPSENPFDGFVVSGNDIEIIKINDKYYLNVKYYIEGDSKVECDEITGKVTFKEGGPSLSEGIAYIKVNDISSDKSIVYFKWQRPYVGEFVYHDGSYSKEISLTKTLVGMIYDIEKGEDGIYTTYIISKNRSFKYSGGLVSYFTSEYKDLDTTLSDVQKKIETFYANVNYAFALNDLLPTNLDKSPFVISNIYDDRAAGVSSTFNKIKNSDSINNTEIYVNWVNTKILPKLYNSDNLKGSWITSSEVTKYITLDGNKYRIDTLDNLLYLCQILENNKYFVNDTNYLYLNASILYPYFYAAYLYAPENATDIMSKGKWYSPSNNDLAKLIFLYGYSASNGAFTYDNRNMVFLIIKVDPTITNSYPETFNTALIFTQACNKLGQTKFNATVWLNMFKSNEPLSTSQNDGVNYGYVKTVTNNNLSSYEWEAGIFRPKYYNWGSNYDYEDLWAYNRREGGLLITKIDYKEGS